MADENRSRTAVELMREAAANESDPEVAQRLRDRADELEQMTGDLLADLARTIRLIDELEDDA